MSASVTSFLKTQDKGTAVRIALLIVYSYVLMCKDTNGHSHKETLEMKFLVILQWLHLGPGTGLINHLEEHFS